MQISRSRQFTSQLCLVLLALMAFCASSAFAEDGSVAGVDGKSRTCPDAKVFSQKLITDICWNCIFPIRIMGVNIGGEDVPEDAADQNLCVCYDNLGVPEPGMGVGMWEPARLVEVVRQSGCAPSLGGITLPGSSRRHQGTSGHSEGDASDVGFYHYHYYAFPLLLMLDLFIPTGCFSDGMMDFDVMYLSELDPTWNNDQLAFFTNPEAAAVANLPAQSACMIDGAMASAGKVTNSMWWCAGAWGSLYPLSGKDSTSSFANMTSILSARAIAALHRRGLALRTLGETAMCEARIEPMLPKTQYRFSMLYPVPEGQDNHVLGETVFNWGFGRKIPVIGEDAVYVVWRWNDCCMRF